MDNNSCRDLKIPEVMLPREDALRNIFSTQKKLQERFGFPTYPSPDDSLGELRQYLDVQYHAMQDEMREFFTALGGVDSHGSAIWKNWKAKHAEAQAKTWAQLTSAEELELQFEWLDMLKFLLNMGMAVGIDADRAFALFIAKDKENHDRIDRGY